MGPDYAAGLRWFGLLAAIGAVLVGIVVAPYGGDASVTPWVLLAAYPLAVSPLVGLLRAWWGPGRTPVRPAGLTRGNRILGLAAVPVIVAASFLMAAPVAMLNVGLALAAVVVVSGCFELFMQRQWKVRAHGAGDDCPADLIRTPGVIEAGGLLAVVVLAAGVADGEHEAALGIVAVIVAWSAFASHFRMAVALIERGSWVGYLVVVASLLLVGAVVTDQFAVLGNLAPEITAIAGCALIVATTEYGRRRVTASAAGAGVAWGAKPSDDKEDCG